MDTPNEEGDVGGSPPHGLPAYRALTGPDDDAFCHRVSDALGVGHPLTGSDSEPGAAR